MTKFSYIFKVKLTDKLSKPDREFF